MSFLFWIIETRCLVKNKNTQVVFQSVFTDFDLLVRVIFNEKINIKITKLLFLWFFATIKILKILKLGGPREVAVHICYIQAKIVTSYRMHLSTCYSPTQPFVAWSNRRAVLCFCGRAATNFRAVFNSSHVG